MTAMSSIEAELSSLATALEELTGRVTAIAEEHSGTARDDLATELFEVERALSGAQRRLARVIEG
jgi:ElaB/YqjD/DUF883 family membrane-anchored ribosome-binding protein